MTRSNPIRLGPSLMILGLLAAGACGGRVGSTIYSSEPAAAADQDPTGPVSGAAFDLEEICPSPLVVQTDWFPEAEHGALYNLLGDDYTIDPGAKTVRGSLQSGALDTGVDLEIRTGGPAIGYQPVSARMYADRSIHLGLVNTDEQGLLYRSAPTLAVVAPLEINPQMIMWDPETYPDIRSLADLGERGITVNTFAGGLFAEVFVAQGIWSQDQVDPSYDGSPARFVSAGGRIAQEGFASAEPFQYENEITEWGRPVAFQLLHDAGFETYPQPLVIRSDDRESLGPCLERLVPIVQRSVVDYITDPARANTIVLDAVATFDDFWIYTPDDAAFSVAQQKVLGLVSNGPDSTVGNFDPERVQRVVDFMTAAGTTVPDGLTAERIVTNEFIDKSIGF